MTPHHAHKRSSALSGMPCSVLGLVAALIAGCATTKDLDTLRAQVNDQVAVVRSDAAQSRQSVEALKSDVILLKSLGVVMDSLKSRLDGMQATVQSLQTEAESHRTTLGNLRVDFKEFRVAHEGVARETDRLRLSVGSLEQGMMHQLQMEVTLARERIKQLEQMIESLQKSAPAEKGKEGPPTPKL
jgi:chromosome segregation ATPase